MYLLNQLSSFKRKAYERHLRNKAASGDRVSKEILHAKNWYTSQKGIVDQSARNVLAKRTKAADTYTPSIIRRGFVRGDTRIPKLDKSKLTLTGKYKGQTGKAITERISGKALETSKQRLADDVDKMFRKTLRESINKAKETTIPKIEAPDMSESFKRIGELNKKIRRNSNIRKGVVLGRALVVGGILANTLRKIRSDKNKKRSKYNKKN